MSLQWVRLDANIASHDKVLHLLSDPSPKKWQAVASYMFSLAWSGGAGTDGEIYTATLSVIHGNPVTARLLVKYHLWDETPTGYLIKNFDQRQELSIVTAAKRAAQSAGAIKANCRRHHGHECGCWREQMPA